MLELPESFAMSRQVRETLVGKKIERVIANSSPHGFAFFYGEPEAYPKLLAGRTILSAKAVAGQVEIDAEGTTLLFNDGVNMRYFAAGAKTPPKHQLYLGFADGSALVCSVQMYGGLAAYPAGANSNPYYLVALEKPSPLTDAFDEAYFDALLKDSKQTLSAKAFLATEQRIPGLGNGVLQDILFTCGIHPMRPLHTLNDAMQTKLYASVKETLRAMADMGGRDTEKDLFGKQGGYRTLLSRKTIAYPCLVCGGAIERKAYLGGNVYYCATCQPLVK